MPYVRMFHSAVDPADAEEVRRLFGEDVRPAFDGRAGCLGIELLVSTESSAGGLLEGMAVSRWESLESMEEGLGSREVSEALVRVLQLLRQEPVTRMYEVLG